MITFVYGAPGFGKTHYVFSELAQDYENSILIVPEQETVTCERYALERLPEAAQLSFEVLNFSRLANRTFRLYGGLSYHYISAGMKSLFMWRTLRKLAPFLAEYKLSGAESSMAPVMLSSVAELKSCGISPKDLENAAEKLPSGSPLRAKLIDTALIYEDYETLVKSGFDDASDDLYKLCEIADKEKIFKGKKIYIDSFTSFTAPELALIKRMFAQADDVTLTVGAESPNAPLISGESIKESVLKLRELASSLDKKIDQIFLTENHRAKNAELRAVNSSLWSLGAVKSAEIGEDERGNVRLISTKNAYSEADAVTYIILSELERGLRYRDIAVIARDISSRNGIIDAALKAASIPHFISDGDTLAAKPVIRLLSSALRIRSLGFRVDDVLANLNTGLYSIPETDADLFCEYVRTWSISGSRFKEVWNMNPDGYTSHPSERGNRILSAANRTRDELIGKLEQFFIMLDAADNAREMCRAVYSYFESIDLAEKLRAAAEAEVERKNRREAADIIAVWNLMMGILDDIATALGDEKLSPDEFLRAFMLAVAEAKSGAIPTGYDEVMLGSASLLRTSEVKCAILIGVNEDEFPKTVKDSGLFSDADRKQLAELGLSVSSGLGTRTSDEFLFARRAMATPSERLYMLYSSSNIGGKALRPSILVSRLRELLPYLPCESYEKLPLFESVRSLSTAVSRASELGASAEADALLRIMEDRGVIAKNREISEPECKISREAAALALGNELRLSQSKIDSYVLCGFNFCCDYLLRLRADEKAEVGFNIMGSFIHSLLEEIVKLASDGDVIDLSLPEEKVEEITDKTIERLLEEICPDEKLRSVRISNLFLRLRRLALLMLRNLREEFTHTSFKPEYFELKIGGELAPIKLKLADGSLVSLTGIIDRVDVLKKDGEVYVRVVDYKTGAKEFSVSDAKEGLNLQLLIYLFTLCRADTDFAKNLGCEDGKAPIPAASHYLSASLPVKKLDAPESPEAVLEDASSRLTRSGIYRGDPAILAELNSEFKKNMLGGITEKDGELRGRGIVDPDGFDSLRDELFETVQRIAQSMKDGNMDADSISKNAKPACDYCKMKHVCRSADRQRKKSEEKENENGI